MLARSAVFATLFVLTAAGSASAAGDATRGKQVFQRCALCHSLAAGQNGIGPSLHGIVGSKAGAVPGYNFSKAMASSGIVWNDDALKKFLANPEAAVSGTKMHAGAIDNPEALDDVVAYLNQAAK